jgi:hypothetical protein
MIFSTSLTEVFMHPRFEAYRATERGRAIEALARQKDRFVEYALLSRLGMPAVIALSWDMAPILRDIPESDQRDAKQYCGSVVGEIMREHGYEIINARGSAKVGGVFTLGAVWAPSDYCHTMKIANEVMNKYSETLKSLAKS